MNAPTQYRCAILDDYQDVALASADWSRFSGRVEFEVFHHHVEDEAELAEKLARFEIIVIMRERTRFPRSLLDRLPALRLLITTGSRNGSIDLEACHDRGVVVCGTRNSEFAAAELTWALILAHQRHIAHEVAQLRNGGAWQSTVGHELGQKSLGVVGLGRLGAQVARVGVAFGMRVQAWSQNLTEQKCEEAGVCWSQSLDHLLQTSDIVTIHLVLSARTRGLIGKRELAMMPAHALLVNTSRASIVDGSALLTALRMRSIGGAALDVFENEPLPLDHPLRSMRNVLATPHIGYVTEETFRIFYGDAVEDIAAWLGGSPVRVIVQQHPAQRV